MCVMYVFKDGCAVLEPGTTVFGDFAALVAETIRAHGEIVDIRFVGEKGCRS